MIFNPVMPNVTELISPRDIKFFPNPANYLYYVDRNSDSVSDGSGNHGSLRYCMNNISSGGTIVFSDVLSDTAGSGDVTTIKILSVLPQKNCSIYGNDHWLTASELATYYIFYYGTMSVYSLHCRDMYKIKTVYYFTTLNIYGCKFHRLANDSGSGVCFQTNGNNMNFYNCDFQSIYGSYYVIGYLINVYPLFSKCNFHNIWATGGGAVSSVGAFVDCYFDFATTILHNNATCSFDRCYKTNGTWVYIGHGTFMNNIMINGNIASYTETYTNKLLTLEHNTILSNGAIGNICPSGVLSGYSLSITFKNNLIISPANTYVFEQKTPVGTRTITESGNIYKAVNTDPYLPNSTRYTSAADGIINLNEVRQSIEYVKHNYFNPKGSALLACSRLSDALTDYNGVSRPSTCDCGAIQT